MGELSTVIISSPKAAREVLMTHDLSFAQRPTFLAADIFPNARSGLFSCPFNDYYKQIRKICTQELLGAQRVQSFWSVRDEEVSNLTESISLSQGLPFNLSKGLLSLANNTISRTAFGSEKSTSQDEFIQLVKEMMTLSQGFNVPDLFPSVKFLSFFTGMTRALERLFRQIDKILQDMIDDHKKQMMRNDFPHKEDLIHAFLKLQKSSEIQMDITTSQIKAVSLDLYIGAGESTAITLEWAISELLKHPRVMEKAQAEVQRVLRGKWKLEETDIQKLDYVKSVIKETLRLHPPVPLLTRECRERCKIGEYDIPVKMKAIVNAWAIGRDPECWINADNFQPERFLGSSIDFKGTDFEYIPFGAGRRICPGLPFGAATLEIALTQLLYNFDLELPNGMKPEELDMTEADGATSRRRNDLYVIATRRTPFFNLRRHSQGFYKSLTEFQVNVH
ncbi:desmethyl-deoxy-podophyllotoxin synthase-like [Juglans microcarpa x Juglans regia]|uniref:desmethyl-deoxy-podophyllotoxin synthase-like n=1 Tax=Juglans microcarpa x Juglans regia TaxID=2249226 RepID=UPI001B7E8826|nr:desmethyl-deoxy-podophyllotoxin synthase-like [Juglans microcarpa x Juglans regia]